MPLILVSGAALEPAPLALPLMACRVSAGFASPADDFIDNALDLNAYLIKRPAATYFARAEGNSLTGIGIESGDLLIIDRAAERIHGAVVVAAINGELTCKVLDKHRNRLLAANEKYKPIDLTGQEDLLIEGVVIYSIKKYG